MIKMHNQLHLKTLLWRFAMFLNPHYKKSFDAINRVSNSESFFNLINFNLIYSAITHHMSFFNLSFFLKMSVNQPEKTKAIDRSSIFVNLN